MKKAQKSCLYGIVALVTVIGLGMTGCDNSTTPNNNPAHTHDWGE
jgi:hypothetical protein